MRNLVLFTFGLLGWLVFFCYPAAAADRGSEATTYVWAACLDAKSADALVATIVNPDTDEASVVLPLNCRRLNFISPDQRNHYPVVLGPLVDIQGNHFTVHAVTQDSGLVAYLFVYDLQELRDTINGRDS